MSRLEGCDDVEPVEWDRLVRDGEHQLKAWVATFWNLCDEQLGTVAIAQLP
jgi:hypothetical protein